MKKNRTNTINKGEELKKYKDLIIATIDYYLDNDLMKIKTSDFNSVEHFKQLKEQTVDNFQKGRLTSLKQWFRDLTEPQIETVDLKFNKYLQEKTGYDIDIFKPYFDRINKIIEKGKITSDNQFYDLNIMVDQLCQTKPVDNEKIEKLNKLLLDYERRKSKI